MLRVTVLVSGGGTNLQAILDAIDRKEIQDVRIGAVISNNPGAYALERARLHDIPALCISPRAYESREAFHQALLQALRDSQADLVVLAGCLVVIPECIIREYKGRMINIHPSLIP